MTRTKFTEQLKDNWPKVAPGVIAAAEKKLAFYSENDIGEIWKLLHESYNKTTSPAYADIINVIKDNNIHQSIGKPIKRHYVFVCKDCDTVFADRMESIAAICCPNCLSEHNSIQEYDGNKHHKVITYQYQCFRGDPDNHYKPSQCVMFNQPGAYGPKCKSWGIQKNQPECRDCICEDCCTKLINENKEWYKRERSFRN